MARFRPPALPPENIGRYRVLVADPPWTYKNKKTGGSHTSGSVQHYETMSVEEVAAMGSWVREVMAPDSVAFCWATTPMAAEKVWIGGRQIGFSIRQAAALSVLEAWQYTFKTKLYWEKTGRIGMGWWFRGQVEECFMGIRGKVKPFRTAFKNIIHASRREHSQKPDEFYALVEKATEALGGPRLELFARGPREGWDTGL